MTDRETDMRIKARVKQRLSPKARLWKLWRDWGRPLLVVFVVLGSVRSTVADWYDVPTGSMKPTILEGERIFVNKLAYDLNVPFAGWRLMEWAGPQRGDVVIFRSPADGQRLVKRVIGLPGDRIEIRDNRLWINGSPVAYEKLEPASVGPSGARRRRAHRVAQESLDGRRHPIMTTPGVPAARCFGPVSVPPGRYFMMGDNRDESFDSRWFGCVERRRIQGRVAAVVISLDPDRFYLPRWHRFLHDLP